MKTIFVIGILTLLGLGAFARHGTMDHSAMAQTPESPMTQDMMLVAQMGDMKMPADKPAPGASAGMSGCGMGGGSMGGMSADKKGSSKGGMMSGMMGDKGMMGCPMMTQAKDGKGMSGCCCSNMGMPKEAPKKPA